MIKLIAMDLDGTLLNNENQIGELTRETLIKAKNQGIYIVIATGRNYYAIPSWIRELDFLHYIVASNGAEIRNCKNNEIIYQSYIEPNKIDEISTFLEKKSYMVEAFVEGRGFIGEKDFYDIKSKKVSFRKVEYVVNTRKPVKDIFEFIRLHRRKIENINIFVEKPEYKTGFIEEIEKIEGITITSSFPCNIEIGGADTSKATAMKRICDILGIDSSQTMAMGDNHNDIEMIKSATIGVAMANAEEDVKEVCDFITDSNENDGVGKTILKFELV